MSEITLADVIRSLDDGWVLLRCQLCNRVIDSWYEGSEDLRTPCPPYNDDDIGFFKIWYFPCPECKEGGKLATKVIQ